MRKQLLTLGAFTTLSLVVQAQVPSSQTFNFTGGLQTFTVPCGVDTVFIQTWGAQGGAGANGNSNAGATLGGSGGLGGYAEGYLLVNAGDVLNIVVGGQGATPTGGFNGGGNGGSQNAGGGGGATDIRVGGTAEANRVIVAGGGGGGGRGGCESTTTIVGGNGGAGGGGIGADGVDAPTSNGFAGGGKGGNFGSSQGAFGPAGTGCAGFLGSPGIGSTTGTGGTGGAGQSCCCFNFASIPGGGGGGGGFIGGGGGGGGSAGTAGCSGNDKGAGGGGGGGSSNVSGVFGASITSGIWLGDGMCTISWTTPAPPAHTITGPSLSCIGTFDTLTVPTDMYSTFYTWTVPAGFNFVSGQNTNSIVVAAVSPGTHTIYVYGVNGNCNLLGPVDSIVITVPNPPQVAASSNGPICVGDTATLSATGSIGTFEWLPGNINGATVLTMPMATTTYSCVITDANGCQNLSTTTVTVNPLPQVSLTALGTHCLADTSFTVTGFSPVGGVLTGSGINGGQFSPSVAGIGTHAITYTYVDNNGCTNSASANVTVDACTGIAENLAFASVNYMPNPAVNMLNITWNTAQVELTVIEVRDLSGRLVLSQPVNGGNTVQLNIENLPTGNYSLTLYSNTAKANYQFVKQ